MEKQLTLILGGARSGKSDYAQRLAVESGKRTLYIATATAGDEEMRQRIAAHQASRPVHWQTVESPLQVGAALRKSRTNAPIILLDCLTLLANNVLFSLPEGVEEAVYQEALTREIDEFMAAFFASQAEKCLVVSNEVGLGLVPEYPLGRLYRDVLGRANQRLAQVADTVVFMVAGLPMRVKG